MSGHTRFSAAGNVLIDPSEFARRGEICSGTLEAGSLPRLAEAVLDTAVPLVWQAKGEVAEIRGVVTPSGLGWFMNLSVTGLLKLRCQRCLEALDWPVNISTRILMVPDTQPLPDEELDVEDFDAISVGRELHLAELIEDELLLGLPLAPTHADCVLPGSAENGEKKSPFAVLAHIKCGH